METNKPPCMRRMNDPTAAAWIRGQCGDTMEVYLTIRDGMIEDATFFTDGCEATMICGSAVAELVHASRILAVGLRGRLDPRAPVRLGNPLPLVV